MPLRQRRKLRIATVSVGARRVTAFQREAKKHAHTKAYFISRKANAKETRQLRKKLQNYDVVLLSLYGPSMRPSYKLGYSDEALALVQDIIRSKPTVTVLFDNAYALTQFPGIEHSRALVMGYQPLFHAQQAAARVVFGKLPARGRLPVTVNDRYRYGDGIRKEKPLIAATNNL